MDKKRLKLIIAGNHQQFRYYCEDILRINHRDRNSVRYIYDVGHIRGIEHGNVKVICTGSYWENPLFKENWIERELQILDYENKIHYDNIAKYDIQYDYIKTKNEDKSVEREKIYKPMNGISYIGELLVDRKKEDEKC